MQTQNDYITIFIAFVRATYHWFHAAHHVTSGTAFGSDHELYGEIYEDFLDVLDGIIEKAIGQYGIENAAAPVQSMTSAISILGRWQSPDTLNSLAIATTALQIEKEYIGAVQELFSQLENSGKLPLGLNDFLAATSNKHDTFVYKLTQRVKTELQN